MLFILATLSSCSDHSVDAQFDSGDPGVVEIMEVDLNLVPGNLNAHEQFIEVELPLTVTESYDLVPIQVGAFIDDLRSNNPDFLRIKFSSNRVEWVGYTQSSIGIYDSEEDCTQFEDYCDKVIVGEGASGYFESGGEYIAIQNAYCRYANESYSFEIMATVYSLEFWPETPISNEATIQISCHMEED